MKHIIQENYLKEVENCDYISYTDWELLYQRAGKRKSELNFRSGEERG